jgi:hypothetical protein
MSKPIYTDFDFQSALRILNLPAGTATGHPVTYEQMNAAIEGLSWKDSVRVASTANINLAAPGATIDGVTMAASDRFLAKDQSTQSQNGIYVWNGAATPATRAVDASTFAELEAAIVPVEEGTSAGSSFRQTQVNGVIDTNNIIFVSAFGTSPAASETTAGIAEIATQAEANTGTDDVRFVTPLKMANWSGRKLKAVGTVGDGSSTTFNVDHNFNTYDVQVEVYKTGGNKDSIICDTTRTTVNRVVLGITPAPAAGAMSYVILA